jgi:hypothetical protein
MYVSKPLVSQLPVLAVASLRHRGRWQCGGCGLLWPGLPRLDLTRSCPRPFVASQVEHAPHEQGDTSEDNQVLGHPGHSRDHGERAEQQHQEHDQQVVSAPPGDLPRLADDGRPADARAHWLPSFHPSRRQRHSSDAMVRHVVSSHWASHVMIRRS